MFIAVFAPNTVMFSGVKDANESIRGIESSDELRYVQQRAVALIKGSAFISRLSVFLSHLAVVTLLVMVGASISLLQIR